MTATLCASRHLSKFVTIANPKWVLYLTLLLGIAKDLTWVFFSHYIEELVFRTNLRVVLVSRVNKFFKDASFNVLLTFLFDAGVFIFAAFALFIPN